MDPHFPVTKEEDLESVLAYRETLVKSITDKKVLKRMSKVDKKKAGTASACAVDVEEVPVGSLEDVAVAETGESLVPNNDVVMKSDS